MNLQIDETVEQQMNTIIAKK